MSVVLVDGSNLFSIHFAANTAMDQNGVPIGAIVGCLRFLSKFVAAINPQRVIIFFDGKNGSAKRRSLYKDYKSGRKPRQVIGRQIAFESPEAAANNQDWQFSVLQELLECLPVQIIITDSYETDDAVAEFVKNKKRYGHENSDVYICSTDRDFSQLLREDVFIYNPVSKSFLSTENFIDKYEISHQNWLFYRAICGDQSDNLKGVKGFGAKTLAKVFNITGSVGLTTDSIRESTSQDNKVKKLQENLETIELNWKLMDLSKPLISLSVADKLDYQLLNFEPKLNKKDFIVKCASLGFVDQSILPRFISLVGTK